MKAIIVHELVIAVSPAAAAGVATMVIFAKGQSR